MTESTKARQARMEAVQTVADARFYAQMAMDQLADYMEAKLSRIARFDRTHFLDAARDALSDGLAPVLEAIEAMDEDDDRHERERAADLRDLDGRR